MVRFELVAIDDEGLWTHVQSIERTVHGKYAGIEYEENFRKNHLVDFVTDNEPQIISEPAPEPEPLVNLEPSEEPESLETPEDPEPLAEQAPTPEPLAEPELQSEPEPDPDPNPDPEFLTW